MNPRTRGLMIMKNPSDYSPLAHPGCPWVDESLSMALHKDNAVRLLGLS